MRVFVSFILLSIYSTIVYGYTSEALADKITSLPGAEIIQSKINFNQFSGTIVLIVFNLQNTMLLSYLILKLPRLFINSIKFW